MLAQQPDIEVVGHADNGLHAIETVRDLIPDVIIMDVGMPELGGVEATRRILGEMPNARVVALSMHSEWSYVSAMLEAGASGYVVKDCAFDELALAIRTTLQGRQFVSPAIRRTGFRTDGVAITGTEPLTSARTPAADLLCEVVEIRDPYTASHQRRVAELAVAIVERLGLPDADANDIRDAALMHDIGKLAVPAEILSKPGALTAAEFALIKEHAEAGYLVLESGRVEAPLAELVYQHHERCDGSGYPRGLMGDALLIGAKILAVADVMEAMLSHRPYRASLGMEAALGEVERGAGTLYDAEVVASCVGLFREGFVFETPEMSS